MSTLNTNKIPVIAIMGHIDHGKSTLLSYIRQSTRPINEAGGITQHISAYEVDHKTPEGLSQKMTFLDTPGHAAFSGIRKRGADVADIAVLVVSAEDGVKPQTIEALKSIQESKTPFIIAITKIDKPEASLERTKLSLAENEIYVEGYGGTVSAIPLSAKTGEGVSDLLDMLALTSDMEAKKFNNTKPATGYILESNLDVQKGISATCILTDGILKKGLYIASSTSMAPLRIVEDFTGKQIEVAQAGQPVKIIGWDSLPVVGDTCEVCADKKEAILYIEKNKNQEIEKMDDSDFTGTVIPLVVKADAGGSLEAVLAEIKKLDNDRIHTKIIHSGIGTISESDLKVASGSEKTFVIGFTTKVDSLAKAIAERNNIEIHTFDIIYKLSEWLQEKLTLETPSIDVEEVTGTLKVLKIFSKVKDKQILGGLVETGSIKNGAMVKIMRRDTEIGTGKIRELQAQKIKSDEVGSGKECGAMVEAKVEIVTGDRLQTYIISKQ
ncbi:MAG: translation initiation factor IF-2 [Minisyncoccota bacterium]